MLSSLNPLLRCFPSRLANNWTWTTLRRLLPARRARGQIPRATKPSYVVPLRKMERVNTERNASSHTVRTVQGARILVVVC